MMAHIIRCDPFMLTSYHPWNAISLHGISITSRETRYSDKVNNTPARGVTDTQIGPDNIMSNSDYEYK